MNDTHKIVLNNEIERRLSFYVNKREVLTNDVDLYSQKDDKHYLQNKGRNTCIILFGFRFEKCLIHIFIFICIT